VKAREARAEATSEDLREREAELNGNTIRANGWGDAAEQTQDRLAQVRRMFPESR
jgi:hypothetical protein